MARDVVDVESGLSISEINGARLAYIISGTAAPDGTSGEQQNAPIGSLYLRSGTGELYQKIANAGAPGDWQLNGAGNASIGTFRPENVVAVTNETQGAGTRDMVVSPFTDDNGTAIPIGEFVVGRYVISDADGTPVLLEITAVSGDDVTFALAANPLVAQDTFVTEYYLPDPDGFEVSNIVQFNGTVMIKIPISTFASTVFLSSGYAAAAGTVAPGDSAEAAIAKLDGNQQAIIDSTLAIGPASIAQNVATTVDSLLVDDFQAALWEVVAHDVGTPANVQILQINGFHNGHAAADATSAKDDVIQKKRIGGNFNLQTSVTISGAGGAQVMNLVLETSDSDGIRYSVRRIASVPAL